MPHEIETMAYVESRGVPWHKEMTGDASRPVESLLTAGEMLEAAGLDWNVSQRPLFVQSEKHLGLIPVPRLVANTRDTDEKVLGVVRPTYHVLQNRAAFEIADDIVDSGEAKYDTAGSLRGGEIVFLSMVVPEGIKVEGDPSDHELYLVLSNGHNGRHALHGAVTVVRTVCKNTLDAAINRSITRFSLRHRSGMAQRIGEARRALQITFAYKETFERVAAELTQKSLVEREVEAILADMFPVPDDLAEGRVRNTTFAGVLSNYRTSPTIEDIRGTAWGVYNAVTEYFDHIADYRGGVATSAEDARAESILFGRTADIREKALRTLVGVARGQ